ncbi:MAG: DUF58 domain-containing protein [Planctomycetaceae bacterium]|nr:DUF58 domain-containing protein [Planctomycetaceae bacterium]MCA9043993.1 DUF58 domain-containing protein [Planctomycetaceae bacterium]MCB9952328.1 DUF58 domain-containing protein [Planctomycetaceae bacterium]
MAWFHNQDVPLHDPTALAKFGKLDVVAKLIVEGYMIGQHKSPFKGSSVEFVEHRQYYPGDEIRHIDWRAYGKTGRYFIKEFEEETNLRAYLIVDCSGSMGYAGKHLAKFDYARLLAACLGYLLIAQRDAVGLSLFDTKVRQRFDPATSPRRFQQITEALNQCKPGQETSLAKVFQTLVPTLKRRSLVIFISDCFDDIDHLGTALQQLRHGRHEVMLFQVLAPEEEDFPFTKPTQFRSLERDTHRILTDPHRLRQIYLEQFHEHQERLTQIAGNLGIDYCKLLTSDPYDMALGAFLDRRTRASK